MRKNLFFIFILCFSGGFLFSVTPRDSLLKKHPQGLYLGIGGSFCGIDVYQNYLQNPRRFAFAPRMCWEVSNTLRFSGEFTTVSPFSFAPSWKNLRAYYIDLNVHFMARIKKEKSIFILLMGLTNHNWKGDFIVQSAFFDAVAGYKPGTQISKNWVGFNIGAGVERAFRHFEFFAEYRYRFSKIDQAFAVSDVALTAGIKKKINLKKIYRKLNDRYTWF
jgi:opacity protein-like surface antigen